MWVGAIPPSPWQEAQSYALTRAAPVSGLAFASRARVSVVQATKEDGEEGPFDVGFGVGDAQTMVVKARSMAKIIGFIYHPQATAFWMSSMKNCRIG